MLRFLGYLAVRCLGYLVLVFTPAFMAASSWTAAQDFWDIDRTIAICFLVMAFGFYAMALAVIAYPWLRAGRLKPLSR